MGAYLSEPITDKESTDESNDFLTCGASSMQGWRMSQEVSKRSVFSACQIVIGVKDDESTTTTTPLQTALTATSFFIRAQRRILWNVLVRARARIRFDRV